MKSGPLMGGYFSESLAKEKGAYFGQDKRCSVSDLKSYKSNSLPLIYSGSYNLHLSVLSCFYRCSYFLLIITLLILFTFFFS